MSAYEHELEHEGPEALHFQAQYGGVPEAEDDTENRVYREVSARYLGHLKTVFACVYEFQGEKMFAVDCAIMAHGLGPYIIGVRDFQQMADRWKCSKENVRKLVEHIQSKIGLPPIEGQRSAAGRKHMSEKRKGQLRPARRGNPTTL